jgi:hypothetical protein
MIVENRKQERIEGRGLIYRVAVIQTPPAGPNIGPIRQIQYYETVAWKV